MWIRLKLIAPFHRPRAPRFGFSSPPLCFDLAMAALRFDQRRFARYGGLAHLLREARALPPRRRLHRHPGAGRDGTVDGFDDRDVDEALDARRLGLAIAAHALREVDQLGG